MLLSKETITFAMPKAVATARSLKPVSHSWALVSVALVGSLLLQRWPSIGGVAGLPSKGLSEDGTVIIINILVFELMRLPLFWV
jgi:hypothetical protein